MNHYISKLRAWLDSYRLSDVMLAELQVMQNAKAERAMYTRWAEFAYKQQDGLCALCDGWLDGKGKALPRARGLVVRCVHDIHVVCVRCAAALRDITVAD